MAELQDNVGPVQKTVSFNWSVELFEQQGNCWLKWSSTAPFRPQQGKVCLYENSFPSDPTHAVAWTWDDAPQPFNTGKAWGSGWCAAYIAQESRGGNYVYVYFLQTAVTVSSYIGQDNAQFVSAFKHPWYATLKGERDGKSKLCSKNGAQSEKRAALSERRSR